MPDLGTVLDLLLVDDLVVALALFIHGLLVSITVAVAIAVLLVAVVGAVAVVAVGALVPCDDSIVDVAQKRCVYEVQL